MSPSTVFQSYILFTYLFFNFIIYFIFSFYLLTCNCFTGLFLLYSEVNQLYVYIKPLSLESLSYPLHPQWAYSLSYRMN